MTLTASQLFTPLPSGVSDGVTPLTVPANTWLSNILANGGNLPVTSWQSGGTAWTELLIFAVGLSVSDANISLVAQGALLDFAATGTVTYVNAQGNLVTVPVTPDPSIPAQNPTGALGWLDALASSVYDTDRLVAGYASGPLYFANATGSSLGTYAAGTFHVANTASGATYSNQAAFTFAASTQLGGPVLAVADNFGGSGSVGIGTTSPHLLVNGQVIYLSGVPGMSATIAVVEILSPTGFLMLGTTFTGSYTSGGKVWRTSSVNCVADAIGPDSNALAGDVTLTTTSVPGGAVSNATTPWSGAAYESNVGLAARCRYKLQSLSVNGPKGAYAFAALTSSLLLAAQSPPATLTSVITRVVPSLELGTGRVVVTVASANGAVPGVANLPVLGATNASPIALTVPSTAGISSGMVVESSGIMGNSAANGLFAVTLVDGQTLSLNGSVGNGAYVSGGNVEAGDLGLVDSIVQQYATPNAVTAATQSAAALTVSVSAVVYVPSAFLADYGTNPTANKGAVALAGYFPTLPIGGVLGIDGQPSGVVPVSAVSDLLFQAGQSGGAVYTVSVGQVVMSTLPAAPPGAPSVDLRVGTTQVAVLGNVNVQVVGV